MKKEFDWDHLKQEASTARYEWLRENYNKPISEDDFIIAMKGIKEFSTSRHRGRCYQPYNLKKHYKNLKSVFNFFEV